MSTAELVLELRERGHFQRFEAACRNPRAAQAEVLRRLLTVNGNTAFGRDHDFTHITDARQWRTHVPVRDYEALRPYMDRVLAGEQGVLTPEDPVMFAMTSGTAGQPKLIPVNASWRRQMGSLLRLWVYAAQRDHPGSFGGQLLSIVSPAIEGYTPGGIPYGSMSGLTAQKAPFLHRRKFAVPPEVSLVKDYDARYFIAMRLALAQTVTTVMTPNPTMLIRLRDVTARHGEALIRAIRDGNLGVPWPELQRQSKSSAHALQDALRRKLQPDPLRAAALERGLVRDGVLKPAHAWPGLVLIGCWLGGSAGTHARALREAFGEQVALRDLGLLASEGRMTLPLEDDNAAGPLYVHANYYEFIPEEHIDEALPPVLGAHELEEGRRYYVILSGGNGLYRYDINDVVEVRGFYHQTPQVAFLRKGRDMVNITGEKLHLNQILPAVREAERLSGVPIWQFRLIPDVTECRYDWLVEVGSQDVSDVALEVCRHAFDQALMALNLEYAAKRASGRLGTPHMHVMQPGWSERITRLEMLKNQRDVQFKWSPLQAEWDEASVSEVLPRTLERT